MTDFYLVLAEVADERALTRSSSTEHGNYDIVYISHLSGSRHFASDGYPATRTNCGCETSGIGLVKQVVAAFQWNTRVLGALLLVQALDL